MSFIYKEPNSRSIKLRKLVAGVGINDADYAVSVNVDNKQILCPIYKKWKSMLVRCYNHKYGNRFKTYSNCTVDERWHSFMAFREWVLSQPAWEGLHLDKDLLSPGNKVYSPDTCLFVPQDVNKFLTFTRIDNNELPIGVACIYNKYLAQVASFNGTRWRSPLVDTIEEASDLYWGKKLELAYQLAASQSDPRIATALINNISRRIL